MQQMLSIDGRNYEIAFMGFDRPLRACMAGHDGEVQLPVWPCKHHLASLRHHLQIRGDALALDSQGYATRMLEFAGVPAPLHADVCPLALWWASGFAPDTDPEVHRPALPDHDGWIDLHGARDAGRHDGLRAKLRPWTWGEKLATQRDCVHDSHGDIDFDPIGYLERMLATCVVAICGGGQELVHPRAIDELINELDAEATQRLLTAVTSVNHPDRDGRDLLSALSPAMAATMLRLCAAMGWTPSRVLATPAPEIERLVALLDTVEGRDPEGPFRTNPQTQQLAVADPGPAARRTSLQPLRPSRIADYPDAVVIVFDDEEDGP